MASDCRHWRRFADSFPAFNGIGVLTREKLRALVRRCEGQDLIEYGLLVGMISAALLASLAQIAPKVSQPFANFANASTPGNVNPGNSNPASGNPGNSNPGNGNPGNSNPGNGNPGNSNPGNGNPGNSNPGKGN